MISIWISLFLYVILLSSAPCYLNQPFLFFSFVDPCNSNPCVYGQCHSDSTNNGGWSCDCSNGWEGQRCDVRVSTLPGESEYQSLSYELLRALFFSKKMSKAKFENSFLQCFWHIVFLFCYKTFFFYIFPWQLKRGRNWAHRGFCDKSESTYIWLGIFFLLTNTNLHLQICLKFSVKLSSLLTGGSLPQALLKVFFFSIHLESLIDTW